MLQKEPNSKISKAVVCEKCKQVLKNRFKLSVGGKSVITYWPTQYYYLFLLFFTYFNIIIINLQIVTYDAPFFTTWFITNWTILFFPLYFMANLIKSKCNSVGKIVSESFRNFRDKGFTASNALHFIIIIIINYLN